MHFFAPSICVASNSGGLETTPEVCPRILTELTTEKQYMVYDPVDRDIKVEAWVMSNRQLRINIYTKGQQGQRNSYLRGRDQFKKILNHFEGKFDEILGWWVRFEVELATYNGTDASEVGDNLAEFNQNIRNGFSVEDAAFETWTGRQAKANKFTKVHVTRMSGAPGNYYDVTAIFSRP